MKGQRQHKWPRTGLRLRAILGCALGLLVLGSPGQGGASVASGISASLIAYARQNPDLCAMLQNLAGADQVLLSPGVGDLNATDQCVMSYTSKSAQLQSMAVSRWASPDAARSQIAADVRNSSNSWVATGDFGDPGYGYDLPEIPDPQSPQLRLHSEVMYARDCYSVFGQAGYDFDTNQPHPPGPMRDLAKAVDRELQKYPCGEKPTVVTSPDVDLQVDHIEVVQVTQTTDNSVPLVAGRTAVVRVFVKAEALSEAASNNTYSVQASLTFRPASGPEQGLKPSNGPIRVKPFVDPIRSSIDDSINFVIRSDQATAGAFSLKAIVNPTHAVAESDFSNNESNGDNKNFEFMARNGLRVGFVRVGYKPEGFPNWNWPTDTAQLQTYDTMMKKLYPVADNSIQYYEMPWRIRLTKNIGSPLLADDFLWTLRGFYNAIQGDKPDILVAWLPNIGADFNGAAEKALVSGDDFLSDEMPHVAMVMETLGQNVPQVTLAHEVAHVLGLEHPGTTGDPACRVATNSRLVTGYWPQEYGDTANIEEPGFDIDAGRVSIKYPASNYDLMAYCPEEYTWITPFSYRKLFDSNMRPQIGNSVGLGTYLALRGIAWAFPGGGKAEIDATRMPDSRPGGNALPTHPSILFHSTNSVISAFAPLTDFGPVQQSGAGNHCVRLLDANGAALYRRCFNLDFLSPETNQPVERSGFVLKVPDPGAGKVASIELVRNDGGQEQQLASLPVSSHAPDLTITSPKAGDRWEGEHTIQWSGSDQDGDALRYDIQYSADGKKSWYPLEIGSHDTQYTFSTDEILPSDQTYFRVLASDGYNTTGADVGPLVVPKQANSPEPPPTPATGVAAPAAGITANTALLFIIGGGVLVVAVGLVLLLVVRRSGRKRVEAPAVPVVSQPPYQPYQPYQPYPPTANPPLYTPANIGALPDPFQVAEQQYRQLRSAVEAGQISLQQYQAGVRQLAVRDMQGYSWMLGEADGLWYVYNGQSWVRADPQAR